MYCGGTVRGTEELKFFLAFMAGGCRVGHPERGGHKGSVVASFVLHCKKRMRVGGVTDVRPSLGN